MKHLLHAVVAGCALSSAAPVIAQNAWDRAEGCVPYARVDWRMCFSAVIYQCSRSDGMAWVQQRMVGPFTNNVLAYDAGGNLIRELGFDNYSDGPAVVHGDLFDYDRFQATRRENILFDAAGETVSAELFLDHGYRFHDESGLQRADVLGRTTSTSGNIQVFDVNAFFLPGVPVMMIDDQIPEAVVWAADQGGIAGGQECDL